MMPRMRIHTGCGCSMCRAGRDKNTRQEFHRKVRHRQKQQLKNKGEVIDIDMSIGYTD